jgi:hypothetical protein
MIFPKLVILNRDVKLGQNTFFHECKLDWNNLDNYKIKESKKWILQFLLTDRSEEESKILKLILDEADWQSELYPKEYQKIFSYYNSFKIPTHYYDEILHLEKSAKKEWKRDRSFDTNVREECLKPAIEFAYLYFYLIVDAIHIWNNIDTDYEIIQSLLSLSLFRFWKNQTGSGLLIKKCLRNFKTENDNYQRLKSAFERCVAYSVIPSRDEGELRKLMISKMRDIKLESLKID